MAWWSLQDEEEDDNTIDYFGDPNAKTPQLKMRHLRQFFKALGMDLSCGTLEYLFELMDVDRDGKIDFDDFITVMLNKPSDVKIKKAADYVRVILLIFTGSSVWILGWLLKDTICDD